MAGPAGLGCMAHRAYLGGTRATLAGRTPRRRGAPPSDRENGQLSEAPDLSILQTWGAKTGLQPRPGVDNPATSPLLTPHFDRDSPETTGFASPPLRGWLGESGCSAKWTDARSRGTIHFPDSRVGARKTHSVAAERVLLQAETRSRGGSSFCVSSGASWGPTDKPGSGRHRRPPATRNAPPAAAAP